MTTEQPRPALPFAGLRVLELSEGPAAAFLGKQFARWGAEVVALRDPARALTDGGACVSEAALHAFLDGGKRLLPLAGADVQRASTVARLATGSDILLSDAPPDRFEAWRAAIEGADHPPSVLTSITPYGLSGPYRDWQATPATLLAHGGYSHVIGAKDGPPLTLVGLYPYYQTALYAYTATVAASLAAAPGTALVEVSVLEALAALHQYTFAQYTYGGLVRRRNGNYWPATQYTCIVPCQDGWAAPNVLPAFWDAFTFFIDKPELRDDPRFADPVERIVNVAALDAEVIPVFATRTKQAILTEGQEQFRLPMGVVSTLDEVLADRHLAARGFWQTVETPAGAVRKTSSPFRFVGAPPPPERPAGGLEPNVAKGFAAASRPASALPKRLALAGLPPPAGPLNGVRVLDLTRVWAGPLATRILADLGAEVIKVEAPDARGPTRPTFSHVSHLKTGERPWNQQGSLNKQARNKLGLCLNLKDPAGRDVFCRLVQVSDVVIDNFSTRAMPGLGLAYEQLRAVNSQIIHVGMPGFGGFGPYRDYISYGPVLEAMSGMPTLLGYGDGQPRVTTKAIPDAIAGTHGAAAVLTALQHRAVSGEGCDVDLSQYEAAVEIIGEYFVDYQLSGELPPVVGNGHTRWAPHGVYPTAGDDHYIAMAVRDEVAWRALSDLAGRNWDVDARFATLAARREHRETLDAAIAGWTREWDARVLCERLQAVGVPAGAVLTGPELLADPQLRARGFFVELDQPDVGPLDYPGTPLHLASTATADWRPAPTLGEHNRQILRGILEMDDAEIDALEARGVIAARPPV